MATPAVGPNLFASCVVSRFSSANIVLLSENLVQLVDIFFLLIIRYIGKTNYQYQIHGKLQTITRIEIGIELV